MGRERLVHNFCSIVTKVDVVCEPPAIEVVAASLLRPRQVRPTVSHCARAPAHLCQFTTLWALHIVRLLISWYVLKFLCVTYYFVSYRYPYFLSWKGVVRFTLVHLSGFFHSQFDQKGQVISTLKTIFHALHWNINFIAFCIGCFLQILRISQW